MVSILVPARNEARNIEQCVGSLLDQTYPRWELIVLDDHSEDDTAQKVRALGLSAGDPCRRLIQGAPLPAGWTGKSWACHQLSLQARGEFLFFTDADTAHAPGTVAAAVAYAQRNHASLVSAWPRLVTVTWSEKLVIPLILLLGMTLYPHWLLILLQKSGLGAFVPRRFRRALGAANGQFLFFSRSAYERIGGHSAVRSHLVEDVALGREVTSRMAEGMRLFNCDALGFSTCRMYRSFSEVWEGFTKNLRPAFDHSLLGFLLIGAAQLCLFFLPFFHVYTVAWSLVGGQIALIYFIRLLLTVRFRTSWWGMLFHPFGHAIGLAIGLNSWRCSATRGVRWKGRTYHPQAKH